jgi:hypothetical protein
MFEKPSHCTLTSLHDQTASPVLLPNAKVDLSGVAKSYDDERANRQIGCTVSDYPSE